MYNYAMIYIAANTISVGMIFTCPRENYALRLNKKYVNIIFSTQYRTMHKEQT